MKERDFIWIVELKESDGWTLMLRTTSYSRDEAREWRKDYIKTYGGEYRVRKYVRTEDNT